MQQQTTDKKLFLPTIGMRDASETLSREKKKATASKTFIIIS